MKFLRLRSLGEVFLCSLLLLLVIEILIKAISGQWFWFYWAQYPVVANALTVCSVILIFYAATGKLQFAFFITAVLFLLPAVVHACKVRFLREVFFFSDISYSMLKTFLDVLPDLHLLHILAPLALVLLTIPVLGWRLFKISRVSLPARTRGIMGSLAVAWLAFNLAMPWELKTRIENFFGIHEWHYHRVNGYFVDGFPRSLLAQLRRHFAGSKLGDYSRSTIASLIAKDSPDIPARKPNLILVLAESFWDPLQFPTLGVSPDPIPNFRRLAGHGISGTIYVPLYGGGTAQTEFEVLTGFSSHFIDGYAYNVLPARPFPTIAGFLRKNGYRTMAIHGYYDWFYNRDKLYPHMGFEEFYTKVQFERDYGSQLRSRPRYIPDLLLAQKIIKESSKPGPFFIFAATSEGHGPFRETAKDAMFSVSDQLPGPVQRKLRANLRSLHVADQAFRLLADHLNHLETETYLVIFGDHLPNEGFLPAGFSGLVSEKKHLYALPLVIISNRGLARTRLDASANFLPLRLMELMKFPQPAYLSASGRLSQKLSGVLLRSEPDDVQSAELQRLFREAQLVQYDLTQGKQFSLR